MLNEKQITQLSKFLSLVLRHRPELIGLELDGNGWANVDALLERSNAHGEKMDLGLLKYIVANNTKKRFAFNGSGDKIRASQGHSVTVELGYTPVQPPEILYHGTAEKFLSSIRESGLQKGNRQHVHISSNVDTAKNVGTRHGKPVVIEVLAQQMFGDGFAFFLSENGVWLTEHVPVKYLRFAGV